MAAARVFCVLLYHTYLRLSLLFFTDGHRLGFLVKPYFRLGFGEPLALSASHGDGMADFAAALAPHYEEWEREQEVKLHYIKSAGKGWGRARGRGRGGVRRLRRTH